MSRPRNICFTLNNYTEIELENLHNNSNEFKYIIFGIEKGELGTPHLQGYAEAYNPTTFKKWKTLIGERCHIEPRLGTSVEASAYCKKDGTYFEYGVISQQGQRNDLETVSKLICNKAKLSDVANQYPLIYIKYHKGLESLSLHQFVDRDPQQPPIVSWLWGGAGVGKTSQIFKKYNIEDIYVKDGTMWWNNYTQQKVILIDDFDGKWPYRDLLRLLDRYPYQGQYKGGYVKINSPFIYITCEYAPHHFWFGNELAQVTRRICEIFEVHSSACTEVAG